MADTKVSALTADTAPSVDDLVMTVNDPGGSPASRKVTVANLTKGLSPTALTDKAAPVGADELVIADSEASNVIKKADAQSVVAGTTALLEGKQTMWIPANAMTPATTSGAATGQIETTTNKVNHEVLDFDTSADEYACFSVAFPKSWDLGTVSFQVWWTSTNAGTDGVAWGLQGTAFADDDAFDAAYGTPVVVTDDNTAAGDILVTAESGAVTISGSPGADELCAFRFFRDVSDANDDMAEDARLLGIKLFFTTNAANDA